MHAARHRTNTAARLRAGLRGQAGFTLIEILIVMTIMVILAGVSLALYTNSTTRAKESVLKKDLFQMREALSEYYADKNNYPPTLQSLVEEKYLREIPEDPFTRSSSTWQEVLSEPDLSNPADQPGVFDVKSGSDAVAIDGTRYSEW
jgi:general secretion pathway protein G